MEHQTESPEADSPLAAGPSHDEVPGVRRSGRVRVQRIKQEQDATEARSWGKASRGIGKTNRAMRWNAQEKQLLLRALKEKSAYNQFDYAGIRRAIQTRKKADVECLVTNLRQRSLANKISAARNKSPIEIWNGLLRDFGDADGEIVRVMSKAMHMAGMEKTTSLAMEDFRPLKIYRYLGALMKNKQTPKLSPLESQIIMDCFENMLDTLKKCGIKEQAAFLKRQYFKLYETAYRGGTKFEGKDALDVCFANHPQTAVSGGGQSQPGTSDAQPTSDLKNGMDIPAEDIRIEAPGGSNRGSWRGDANSSMDARLLNPLCIPLQLLDLVSKVEGGKEKGGPTGDRNAEEDSSDESEDDSDGNESRGDGDSENDDRQNIMDDFEDHEDDDMDDVVDDDMDDVVDDDDSDNDEIINIQETVLPADAALDLSNSPSKACEDAPIVHTQPSVLDQESGRASQGDGILQCAGTIGEGLPDIEVDVVNLSADAASEVKECSTMQGEPSDFLSRVLDVNHTEQTTSPVLANTIAPSLLFSSDTVNIAGSDSPVDMCTRRTVSSMLSASHPAAKADDQLGQQQDLQPLSQQHIVLDPLTTKRLAGTSVQAGSVMIADPDTASVLKNTRPMYDASLKVHQLLEQKKAPSSVVQTSVPTMPQQQEPAVQNVVPALKVLGGGLGGIVQAGGQLLTLDLSQLGPGSNIVIPASVLPGGILTIRSPQVPGLESVQAEKEAPAPPTQAGIDNLLNAQAATSSIQVLPAEGAASPGVEGVFDSGSSSNQSHTVTAQAEEKQKRGSPQKTGLAIQVLSPSKERVSPSRQSIEVSDDFVSSDDHRFSHRPRSGYSPKKLGGATSDHHPERHVIRGAEEKWPSQDVQSDFSSQVTQGLGLPRKKVQKLAFSQRGRPRLIAPKPTSDPSRQTGGTDELGRKESGKRQTESISSSDASEKRDRGRLPKCPETKDSGFSQEKAITHDPAKGLPNSKGVESADALKEKRTRSPRRVEVHVMPQSEKTEEKRKRGRPPKSVSVDMQDLHQDGQSPAKRDQDPVKRKRGRPSKSAKTQNIYPSQDKDTLSQPAKASLGTKQTNPSRSPERQKTGKSVKSGEIENQNLLKGGQSAGEEGERLHGSDQNDDTDNSCSPAKKKRGRPAKNATIQDAFQVTKTQRSKDDEHILSSNQSDESTPSGTVNKRKRGRPPKGSGIVTPEPLQEQQIIVQQKDHFHGPCETEHSPVKRKRGRPKETIKKGSIVHDKRGSDLDQTGSELEGSDDQNAIEARKKRPRGRPQKDVQITLPELLQKARTRRNQEKDDASSQRPEKEHPPKRTALKQVHFPEDTDLAEVSGSPKRGRGRPRKDTGPVLAPGQEPREAAELEDGDAPKPSHVQTNPNTKGPKTPTSLQAPSMKRTSGAASDQPVKSVGAAGSSGAGHPKKANLLGLGDDETSFSDSGPESSRTKTVVFLSLKKS